MGRNIGYLLAFAAGVVSGAAGAYFYCQKQFGEKLDAEIAAFKKEYRGTRVKELQAEIKEENESYKEKNGLGGIPEKMRERVDIDQIAYHKMRDPYVKPDISEFIGTSEDGSVVESESAEDVLAKAEHPEDGDEEDIRIVSVDEYNTTEYERVGLVWYTEDDVLTDQFGDIIEDTLPVVGEVLETVDLSNLEEKSDTPPSVFVVNVPLEMMYDVTIIRDSYENMIE